ncbi:DNA mismatch repair endonuclease MutL [Saliterribacillus persicus]|uniref:DNA mismatch repair protein MutL n=1 Tax=Saliterribacillus persicus TaxID=930114 RepID=A0A368XRG6_9BACI|nr:DNA mismatch repair endonuclease MutL [Saliterribacillus persicus]RCW70640.1 DNA mismatch repair protein MutL [Saliterribacillus persicus]
MAIFQMPDILANKIAAGEVVERPASVVKELVENSIDANSKWIKIEIEEAGLSSITVADDGDGMDREDCKKAFFRHATSKIKNEQDLFHVRSLGFRGEALASIAAVSRLQIKTSDGTQSSSILALEGGRIISESYGDARKGTEIAVKDLFYNTPARLKYMKTIHTELGHISDTINRMAFSHPDIRFELVHNGNKLFFSSGKGELLQIIAQVYGMSVAKAMIPVEYKTLDFSISGFIAKPEVNRASRNYMTTVVNGRYIRSMALARAIYQGFHTLLPIGRQPIVVLNIEMDPVLVDVNVHPAKLEVRFSKEKELFQAIEEMIKNALREQRLIPAGHKKVSKEKSLQHSFMFGQEKNPEASEKLSKINQTEVHDEKYPWNAANDDSIKNENISSGLFSNDSPVDSFYEKDVTEKEEAINNSTEEESEQQAELEDQTGVPQMYPIGQHHGTYILAQNEAGLYIIDQHAAQERIKYEFFKDMIGDVSKEVQELLVPITFEFTKQETLLIEEHKVQLEKVGLFFEEFGHQTYIIRSHPNWFPKGFEEEVIREMIEQIMDVGKIDIYKLREEAAILMSCKRSIKANHYLNNDDMFQLLEDLRKCTDPFTCPHGRPIIIQFSTYEMEKMFKRIM